MGRTIKVIIIISVFFNSLTLLTAAAEWEQIVLYSWNNEILYKATSELDNPEPNPFNPGEFSAARLFDADKNTCWAEGAPGNGIGEAVFFKIPEKTRTLLIINGFAENETLFFENNRVKKMLVSIYVGVSPEAHVSEVAVQYFALKYEKEFLIEMIDISDEQEMSFPVSWRELQEFRENVVERYQNEKSTEVGSPADVVHFIIKFEIQDVYQGSENEHTCLSEIKIEKGIDSVNSIYLSEDEGAVLIDTNEKQGVEVDRDKEAVFQVLSSTEDNQWVICIKMPREKEGRAETEYVLYNTFVPKRIEKNILGEHVLDMYGFVKREGKVFLEYFNSETSQIEYLDLDKIMLR